MTMSPTFTIDIQVTGIIVHDQDLAALPAPPPLAPRPLLHASEVSVPCGKPPIEVPAAEPD